MGNFSPRTINVENKHTRSEKWISGVRFRIVQNQPGEVRETTHRDYKLMSPKSPVVSDVNVRTIVTQ